LACRRGLLSSLFDCLNCLVALIVAPEGDPYFQCFVALQSVVPNVVNNAIRPKADALKNFDIANA
jgi:hypothetical protein